MFLGLGASASCLVAPTHIRHLIPYLNFDSPPNPSPLVFRSGRLISKKPANAPYLNYKSWAQIESEKDTPQPPSVPANDISPNHVPVSHSRPHPRSRTKQNTQPWTWKNYLLTVLIVLSSGAMMGNFLMGSPVWGYEAKILKKWNSWIHVSDPIYVRLQEKKQKKERK